MKTFVLTDEEERKFEEWRKSKAKEDDIIQKELSNPEPVEFILCAATWYKDFPKPKITVANCHTGVVLCGHRHGQIVHQHVTLMNKRSAEMGAYVQGFLTSKNRFVDRQEGWKIAEANKQRIAQSGGFGTLYSEDIY